jgi:hypothetical protein
MHLVRTAIVFAITSLVLCGCNDSLRQALGRCEVEAQRLYPGKPLATVDLHRYVKSCMSASGYEIAATSRCSEALPVPNDCYLTWWDVQWGNSAERDRRPPLSSFERK